MQTRWPVDCCVISRVTRALAIVVFSAVSAAAAEEPHDGAFTSEFVFEQASFPQCHASTIATTKQGLVVAWFGGTREKNPDVGVWLARHVDGRWTDPVEVADGVKDAATRYPCWNPVLYQMPEGALLLFYKVGPSPSTWWGMMMQSQDGGATWSTPVRLPDGIAGPIKNKPVMLPSGRLLCGSSTEDQGWRVHLEWTADSGKNWARTEALNDGRAFGAIQPTILQPADGSLRILCRSRGLGKIVTATSTDQGNRWTELTATSLPNPNSGIDAVTLADGRHLLVYNHTGRGRSPLNVAVSDDGIHWQAAAVLESERGEYSYPAVVQAADAAVHITYTWKRQRIKHVELNLAKLEPLPIVEGRWPQQ